MRDLFVCYRTDAHHSYASRDLIGIGTSMAQAYKICRLQAKKEGHKIDADQRFNLFNSSQTQGYQGIGEFHIDPVQRNKLV